MKHPKLTSGAILLMMLALCCGIPSTVNGQCIEGDCLNGKGTFKFENGATYSGEWDDGQFNGNGRLNYANGDTYEGQFKNGQRSGQGVCQWLAGHRYEGQWQNDTVHGKGNFQYASGNTYSGEFKNGTRDGYGIGTGYSQTYDAPMQYEGQWKDGKYHGQGKWSVPSKGVSYEGGWNQSGYDGYGRITNINMTEGGKYTGEVFNGKRHGQGTATLSNGDVFEGRFDSLTKTAVGTMRYANGTVATGKFQSKPIKLLELTPSNEYPTFWSEADKKWHRENNLSEDWKLYPPEKFKQQQAAYNQNKPADNAFSAETGYLSQPQQPSGGAPATAPQSGGGGGQGQAQLSPQRPPGGGSGASGPAAAVGQALQNVQDILDQTGQIAQQAQGVFGGLTATAQLDDHLTRPGLGMQGGLGATGALGQDAGSHSPLHGRPPRPAGVQGPGSGGELKPAEGAAATTKPAGLATTQGALAGRANQRPQEEGGSTRRRPLGKDDIESAYEAGRLACEQADMSADGQETTFGKGGGMAASWQKYAQQLDIPPGTGSMQMGMGSKTKGMPSGGFGTMGSNSGQIFKPGAPGDQAALPAGAQDWVPWQDVLDRLEQGEGLEDIIAGEQLEFFQKKLGEQYATNEDFRNTVLEIIDKHKEVKQHFLDKFHAELAEQGIKPPPMDLAMSLSGQPDVESPFNQPGFTQQPDHATIVAYDGENLNMPLVDYVALAIYYAARTATTLATPVITGAGVTAVNQALFGTKVGMVALPALLLMLFS